MPVETALVVDDSKSARIMLSRLVQKVGLEVTMVESGEEAIAHLENLDREAHPDVIFMDHMMPGMDGLQTTSHITQNPATQHIPIFMYTSKEGDEYEQELLACGATGMLGKPAKPERLREIVAELNSRPETPALDETVQGTTGADVADTLAADTTASDTTASTSTQQEQTPAPEYMAPQDDTPAHSLTPDADEIASAAAEAPASEPAATEPEQEEETMSKEMIEEVASPMIARAIEEALQPLRDSLNRMETQIAENQSEIRKLNSRQANTVGMVTQPVLDASLKQTTTQLQTQITNDIKALRDLIESRAELAPEVIQQITDLATQAGSEAGTSTAEKAASSAAEAVAAKVGAAQAQVQVEQELAPVSAQVGSAKTMAVVALVGAIVAIALPFIL